jgi:hypothetical protein
LTIFAGLEGYGEVVFANERSADEPTMDIDGLRANHQYSKSSDFESLVRDALAEVDPVGPSVFSILRPYSELWIGRAFSRLQYAFGRFTSCNRNFRLAGNANRRWCGECAKCAFTSLILAPFIGRQEALDIFGDIFLDRPQLLNTYRELCGLSEHKPWDCVGTIDECRAAILHCAAGGPFAQTTAVSMLSEQLSDVDRHPLWDRAMEPAARAFVPERYLRAAARLA